MGVHNGSRLRRPVQVFKVSSTSWGTPDVHKPTLKYKACAGFVSGSLSSAVWLIKLTGGILIATSAGSPLRISQKHRCSLCCREYLLCTETSFLTLVHLILFFWWLLLWFGWPVQFGEVYAHDSFRFLWSHAVVAHPPEDLMCCTFWDAILLIVVPKRDYLSYYRLPVNSDRSGHSPLQVKGFSQCSH